MNSIDAYKYLDKLYNGKKISKEQYLTGRNIVTKAINLNADYNFNADDLLEGIKNLGNQTKQGLKDIKNTATNTYKQSRKSGENPVQSTIKAGGAATNKAIQKADRALDVLSGTSDLSNKAKKEVDKMQSDLNNTKELIDFDNPAQRLSYYTAQDFGMPTIKLSVDPAGEIGNIIEGASNMVANPIQTGKAIGTGLGESFTNNEADPYASLNLALGLGGVAELGGGLLNKRFNTPIQNEIAQQLKPNTTPSIMPKTEVNIPSIQNGKTPKQVANSSIKKSLGGDNIKNKPMDEIDDMKVFSTMVENEILPKHKNTNIPSINKQAARQAEANELGKRMDNLQQKIDAAKSVNTGEPNVDLNLVNMGDLLPKDNSTSVYEFMSKYNPEAYSRAEYAPYAVSFLIDKYAKATGISPEQALNIFKDYTSSVWDLKGDRGVFIPSKDNGFVRVLNPEAYRWSQSNNPEAITYLGATGGNETLLNTIIHEDMHKFMMDLNAKVAKGEITPEGAEFLMRYNGFSPQGAKSESISHAAGSIPLEGDLKIPEKRIKTYNKRQPNSEFSNESFTNYRDMLGKDVRQRAIDAEFGLINKEFESNVDKYLNGLGVNRFGGYTW